MKLGNQYRGLDAEEIGFLNARKAEQRAKEQAIREDEQRGLAEYRQYVFYIVAMASKCRSAWPAEGVRRIGQRCVLLVCHSSASRS